METTTSENSEIKLDKLRRELKNVFGKPVNSVRDFELLAETTHLSIQTLRRFFGKIDKDKSVSKSSLNIICQYIGYIDWEDFLNHSERKTSENITSFADAIFPFYDNVIYHEIDVFSKGFFDIHYDYSKVILEDEQNCNHFLQRYRSNPEILRLVFSIFPYYDKVGQNWYQKAMQRYLSTESLAHAQVSMNSFLAFGAYLQNDFASVEKFVKIAERYVPKLREEYEFFSFPETRFCIAKLMQLQLKNDRKAMIELLEETTKRNEECCEKEVYVHEKELLYFYVSNALVWMGEKDLAWEISRHLLAEEGFHPLAEISRRFLKNYLMENFEQTLEMVILLNGKGFEKIAKDGFQNKTNWCMEDFSKIQRKLISLKKLPKLELSKRLELKAELQYLKEKTGFERIDSLIPMFE